MGAMIRDRLHFRRALPSVHGTALRSSDPGRLRRFSMYAKRSSGVALVLLLFVLGLAAAPARADIYMKQKTHTGAFTMMGQSQPEKDETNIVWLGENKVRVDNGNGQSTLLLGDKGLIYVIDNNKKTYTEMPLDMGKAMNEAMAGQGERGGKAAEMMKGMMKGMMGGMSVTVTDAGETKKIGAWNCRKYLVAMKMPMGETNSETWATEDIKIDAKLYFTAVNAMMASMPGFQDMLKEMQKVKGVVAYQSTKAKMRGSEVASTMELLECADKGAPAGTYDLPAGYTKVKGMKGM
jgi:hypothetical protein